jgi:hypothetical protein
MLSPDYVELATAIASSRHILLEGNLRTYYIALGHPKKVNIQPYLELLPTLPCSWFSQPYTPSQH